LRRQDKVLFLFVNFVVNCFKHPATAANAREFTDGSPSAFASRALNSVDPERPW
jgi:hypothetical protein